MTAAQKSLYWREWAACKKALTRHGYGSDELEAQRHRLHIEALGTDKSSKSLTNADLDAILAIFRAYSRPADLSEQLRIIDQPDKRLQAYRHRAMEMLIARGIEEQGRIAYLEQLSRRLCGRSWHDVRETEAAKICGVLAERIKAKHAS
jgi:hypothetical protein